MPQLYLASLVPLEWFNTTKLPVRARRLTDDEHTSLVSGCMHIDCIIRRDEHDLLEALGLIKRSTTSIRGLRIDDLQEDQVQYGDRVITWNREHPDRFTLIEFSDPDAE